MPKDPKSDKRRTHFKPDHVRLDYTASVRINQREHDFIHRVLDIESKRSGKKLKKQAVIRRLLQLGMQVMEKRYGG